MALVNSAPLIILGSAPLRRLRSSAWLTHQSCSVSTQTASISPGISQSKFRLRRTRHHAGVTSAVGGLLQLAAGAPGRSLPRHHILGVGKRLASHLLCARRPCPELLSVFLLDDHVAGRRRGAASGEERPVVTILASACFLFGSILRTAIGDGHSPITHSSLKIELRSSRIQQYSSEE